MMKLFLLAALSLSTSSVYAHNCNKSTGYSTWCESLGECIRDWETTCPPSEGGDRDKHGCIGSAGETWCKAKNKGICSWEENCDTPSDCTGLGKAAATHIAQEFCGNSFPSHKDPKSSSSCRAQATDVCKANIDAAKEYQCSDKYESTTDYRTMQNKCEGLVKRWTPNSNGLCGAFPQFLTNLAVSEEEEPTSTSVDTETGESLSSDSSVDTETEESLPSVDEE